MRAEDGRHNQRGASSAGAKLKCATADGDSAPLLEVGVVDFFDVTTLSVRSEERLRTSVTREEVCEAACRSLASTADSTSAKMRDAGRR